MLKTGRDYLEGLRDGRIVYIGRERVEDVTTHPAFRNAARILCRVLRSKSATRRAASRCPTTRTASTHSIYYLKARTKEDLARRSLGHRILAEANFGLLGRSPDYIAKLCDRHESQAGAVRPIRRQRPQLLPSHARQRHLRRPRHRLAAGCARSGFLPAGERAKSELPRGSRRRRRRRDQRHEDAGDECSSSRRDLDRKHPAAGAGSEGRVGHVCGAVQHPRLLPVVAQTHSAERAVGNGSSAQLAVRRA